MILHILFVYPQSFEQVWRKLSLHYSKALDYTNESFDDYKL